MKVLDKKRLTAVLCSIVALILMVPILAFSARSSLQVDGLGMRIYSLFAPDGKKDRTLTVNSVTIDMRDDIAWSQYATAACKYRTMSTATKAGATRTLPTTTWTTRGVNQSTPYLNFTGCTGGELQRQ